MGLDCLSWELSPWVQQKSLRGPTRSKIFVRQLDPEEYIHIQSNPTSSQVRQHTSLHKHLTNIVDGRFSDCFFSFKCFGFKLWCKSTWRRFLPSQICRECSSAKITLWNPAFHKIFVKGISSSFYIWHSREHREHKVTICNMQYIPTLSSALRCMKIKTIATIKLEMFWGEAVGCGEADKKCLGRHRHAALASNFYKLNLQMYDCPGLHLEHTPLVSGS